MVGIGIFSPPAMITSTDDRSRSSMPGTSRIARTIAGAAQMQVTRDRSISSTTAAGSKVRWITVVAPTATIDVVTESGLRGRGGGGFPTGRKWAGVASQGGGRRFLVCNGAEGEPGTFKDRALLRANPYQLVEGVVIAAFAIGASETFICLKASFRREIEVTARRR